MTNKTPFELRYDLLAMAKDILSDKMYGERNRIDNDWVTKREVAFKEGAPVPPAPEVPNIDANEIIRVASVLNEFVSNGKTEQ